MNRMQTVLTTVLLFGLSGSGAIASDYVDDLGIERAENWSIKHKEIDYVTRAPVEYNLNNKGWISNEALKAGARRGLEEKCKREWESLGLNELPDEYISTYDPDFNSYDINQFNTILNGEELYSEAFLLKSRVDLTVAEYRHKCKPLSLNLYTKEKKKEWLTYVLVVLVLLFLFTGNTRLKFKNNKN